MTRRMPSLFVSHGAPTLAIDEGATRDFLRGLGSDLGRPKAIVVASAHWEALQPSVTAAPHPETVHDFYGFPRELYAMRYNAPGDPALAQKMVGMLNAAGLQAIADPERGLDHGAWVPLSLMYPQADIPVVELSVQSRLSPQHHFAMGQALAPLRDEGVLILGSGSSTHNLRELSFENGEAPEWARSFDEWVADAVAAGDSAALLDYAAEAPNALRNHPTPEHFLPFFVALGAGGGNSAGRRIYRDFTYGSLSMASFAWT